MGLLTSSLASSTATGPKAQTSGLGYPEGFALSALWSVPGLIGINPPKDVQKWEAENPGSAVAAGLLGFSGPLVGSIKAAKSIPALAKGIEAASKVDVVRKAPIRAAAKRAILEITPLEATRLGAAATLGQPIADELGTDYRGFGDVALSSGLDFALVGAASGGLELAKSAGRVIKRKLVSPGAELDALPQAKLRTVKGLLEKGEGDQDLLKGSAVALGRQVRLEESRHTGGYIEELEGAKFSKSLARLFRPSNSGNLGKLKLTVSNEGPTLRSQEEVATSLKEIGIGDKLEAVRFPRLIELRSKSSKNIVEKQIIGKLNSTEGVRWTIDKGDGTFIIAKPLPKSKSSPFGRWALFKTDQPGLFLPKAEKYANLIKEKVRPFGLEERITPVGAPVWDRVAKMEEIPLQEFRGLDTRKGRTAELTKQVWRRTGLDKVFEPTGELFRRFGQMVRGSLAPAVHQAAGHPRAARAVWIARNAIDTAEGEARRIFFGEGTIKEAKTLYGAMLSGVKPAAKQDVKPVVEFLEELAKDQDEWVRFWQAWKSSLNLDEAIGKLELGPKGVEAYKKLTELDLERVGHLQTITRASGEAEFVPLENHLGISRLWRGQWRVPVLDGNKVVWMGSGTKRAHALQDAENFIARAEAEGLHGYRAGSPVISNELVEDIKLMAKLDPKEIKKSGQLFLRKGTPKTISKKRTGVGGFIGEETPTLDEAKDLVFRQLRDYKRYEAKLAVKKALQRDLDVLKFEDRALAEKLNHRIELMFGAQGNIGQAINKAFDRVLAPSLGPNSASKIAAAMNHGLFHMTLGFANVGFNVANLLTSVQTALPQMAWLAKAPPAEIAKFYTMFPVLGQKTVGHMNVLDSMKLLGESFKLLARPDKAFKAQFVRAANEFVWDPKWAEEFVGQAATRVTNLKGLLKGDQPFASWLDGAASFLPAQTEKFARGHAFALGWTFFKKVMRIEDDELAYQMTKRFVENTHFLYSTGDRAEIITGPLGSTFGLFKNWVMNYLAWMAEYTGEGVLRGNWSPLLWSVGSTATVGGIGAIPLFSVADAFSKYASDKTLMQHTYRMFGSGDTDRSKNADFADIVYYGLPAAFGFVIQNQVAGPFADLGQDAARLTSFAFMDRARFAGRAFGQAYDHFMATGELPVRDANTQRLMARAFLPKNLYRTIETAKEGVLESSSSGKPILQDVTTTQKWMYRLGLNERWIETQLGVGRELWKDQDKMRKQVSTYGRELATLTEEQDYAGLKNLYVRMAAEAVDFGRVMDSARTHLRRSQSSLIQEQFSPMSVAEYQKLGLVGR